VNTCFVFVLNISAVKWFLEMFMDVVGN